MSATEEVLAQISDSLDDWEVGPDAMRCNAPAEERAMRVPQQRYAIFGASVNIRPFLDAIRQAAEDVAKAIRGVQPYLHLWVVATDEAHKRARCQTCNPRGNPRPLCIDGHAYRRRKRRRKRR